MKYKQKVFGFFLIFFLLFFLSFKADAAILTLSPNSGSFSVGSTFDVSLFLNTEKESVNAIEVGLSFPADKLQLVSPSTGKSIISVWTAPPTFSNQTGKINLQGGIPGGINVSNGLFTTLTFRVKGVGSAILKFLDETRVLLNDGLGTDGLKQTEGAIFKLTLPPPGGPIVISETHPDQSRWYSNRTAILQWAPDIEADGYSYVVSDEPVDLPDNTSEGLRTEIAYKNLSDGVHYFHIKALRAGVWGGTTHFALNIDSSPPASFPVKISPSARTTSKQPILNFETTDALSGIDYYEYKIISLKPITNVESAPKSFFIEAEGSQILKLDIGAYDVIVRAYDKAGNFQEVSQKLEIVKPLFQVITGKGIQIGDFFVIGWIWIWIFGISIILILTLIAWLISRWHKGIILRKAKKELPFEVKNKLQELQKYRQRYGKIAVIFLLLSSFLLISKAHAQNLELSPPLVSTVSRDISNEEIFYIGGKTDVSNAEVIIYLQNLQTGETMSGNVTSDKKGEWFYRHPAFLSSGNYLLWSQTKLGDSFSPPSPQIQMTVRPTAVQFGVSRLSFESLYLISIIILLLLVFGLVAFIIFHIYSGKKKKKLFWKEVKEAEDAVHRGFAVLRRDIEAELSVVRKAKLNKVISIEEKAREAQLLKDLENIEKFVGKEVWDIEKIHPEY